MLNLRQDSIGMSWINDEENGIVWHDRGTDKYNRYLGFDTESETSAVIPFTLSLGYRIPVTVLGVKRMEGLSGQ